MNNNEQNINKVFILGAGFSKAFFKDSPLLIDYYELDEEKIKKFPYANKIYQSEKRSDGKINIERLMTRLSSRMPYDFDDEDLEITKELQIDLLNEEIVNTYLDRLDKTKKGNCDNDQLLKFASYCINNNINCVTFNHDDYFDKALYEASFKGEQHWNPDTGYGFFCKPSESIIRGSIFENISPIFLLKLHGSINWYIKKGYSCDLMTIENLVHHEEWRLPEQIQSIIKPHLESEPFFVPPILEKSNFADQPILRIVWSQAFEKLENADHIVFIGYSLPNTDNIIAFLLSETIKKDNTKIDVVNFSVDDEEKENLRNRYKKLFPLMKNDQFYWDGALEWTKKILQS